MRVEREVAEQRSRNHAKWGDRSIEGKPPTYAGWLPALIEEVSEVARALQEGDARSLRAETIDALAVCWMLVDAIDRWCAFEAPPGGGYVCYRCGRESQEHQWEPPRDLSVARADETQGDTDDRGHMPTR